MIFDIDVSGEDILSGDYAVCISDNNQIIKAFKMHPKTVNQINKNFNLSKYTKYKPTLKKKKDLKIRIYSIIIYYIFKELNLNSNIELKICRDFYNREQDIIYNLEYFLITKLNLRINNIKFCKLESKSLAHKYSYLIRKNLIDSRKYLIKISLEEIELFLSK